MPALLRSTLAAFLALVLCISPAFATEASDAYKSAKAMAKRVDAAGSDEDRAAAQKELEDFARKAAAALLGGDLGKMDTAYVGEMLTTAGMHAEGVATLKKAIDHPGTSKYESTIYIFYIRALIAKGDYDEMWRAWEEMADKFQGDKKLKTAAMSVGLAMRTQRRWADSAKALDAALKMKNSAALKPLVNSLLLDGQKDAAIAAIDYTIEKAGEAMAEEGHQVLRDISLKWGEKLPLEFDAFAPGEAPDLEGKVVVLGAWTVSAGSLTWTMDTLTELFNEFPPTKGVVVLGLSTYYQKNPDTGKIDESMTTEAEREFGLSYRNQLGFPGQLAYVKDRDALQALGISALPSITIIGKDGKLRYSHTMNRQDPTEIEVVKDLIRKWMK